MRKRRNNLDIAAEILRAAKNGAKKTHIVYGANLNFKLLEKYTEELENLGLVTIENGNKGIIKTQRREYNILTIIKTYKNSVF